MTGPGEPPDSWPVWGELVGIAAVGFVCGVIVGYVRAPRAQRRAVNDYVLQAMSDRAWELSRRTQTVLAVLKVRSLGSEYEIEQGLIGDGDFVREATVMPDRRLFSVPVQADRRGTYQPGRPVPDNVKAKAF